MKLLPVLPLEIVGKSQSGLAIKVVRPAPEGVVPSPRKALPFGIWLPLSCVILEGGKVVAVADWLRKKNRLAPAIALKD